MGELSIPTFDIEQIIKAMYAKPGIIIESKYLVGSDRFLAKLTATKTSIPAVDITDSHKSIFTPVARLTLQDKFFNFPGKAL